MSTPIKYKIDILTALKEKVIQQHDWRKEKLMGEATIQRLRHGLSVYEVLANMCFTLTVSPVTLWSTVEEREKKSKQMN